MTTVELVVITTAILSAAVAVVGVQVRLIAALTDRIASLELSVQALNIWHDDWATMPADTSNATMLDRRLSGIEARLTHIEHTLDQTNPVAKDPR